MASTSIPALARRARALAAANGGRAIIGIVGAPGSGKSTLAELLVSELGEAAVLVPMDGFHYAQAQLDRLGRAARKGAPDTFDATGYVAMLRRIRAGAEDVYAPTFERSIEEPIAGAIAVPAAAGIVVTEGNYLLLDRDGWSGAAELLDESWYLAVAQEVRVPRLVARHELFGRTRADAEAWAEHVDEPNALVIEASAVHADLIVELEDLAV